ncbi:Phosphatidyl-N-methylethanolamine N-methyltransferase, partial [Dimargaris xerosporica]
ITIFLLGIFRDLVFNHAIDHQPQVVFLGYGEVKLFAIGLWLVGTTLVLSSMYKLGLTGTYLGDYFGILMDSIVTDFPFNVTSNPMYHGSTLNFVAVALYKQSVAGLALALLVYIMYAVALRFEE